VVDGRTADRTLLRYGVRFRAGRAQFEHRSGYVGNHVARAAHDDGVARADVLAMDVGLVVQRGHLDRHAAELHGL